MGSLGQAAQNGASFNPYGQSPMAPSAPPRYMGLPPPSTGGEFGSSYTGDWTPGSGTMTSSNFQKGSMGGGGFGKNRGQTQSRGQALTFSPQSPMGGFPQQPQGAGPDVTGNYSAANMGYDQSGSDAGIGGQAVLGVQSPLSLSQLRPQQGGLQIQGNPTMQQFIRGQRMR